MNPASEVQLITPRLGLWDAISIILGIIIGAGIYETPPGIFQTASGPALALGLWAVAGMLVLVGALCYAELATTYPRSGGDYVYLTRAYGPLIGFLFGWAQLAVIQTGSIGLMAYIFADYAARLWPEGLPTIAYAALAVVGMSALNLLGVVLGKAAQNVLTLAKVLGLGGILVAGFAYPAPDQIAAARAGGTPSWGALASALVFVSFTYGGWNDAAFVAAEVRNRRRNLPLALIVGTVLVTVLYLLVNAAYLNGLGYARAAGAKEIAADTLKLLPGTLGAYGEQLMCVLVMVSALGAVNGLIFTSSRIYATLGADYSLFAVLGKWHPRLGSPVWSLGIQMVITLAMVVAVGTSVGQEQLNQALEGLGLERVTWAGQRGFYSLLRCTAPVFWLFFLLTALSVFVLRINDQYRERPFAVPLYPVLPLVFCATCGYMLYSGIAYAGRLGLVGGALVLAGIPFYVFSRRTIGPETSAAAESKHGVPGLSTDKEDVTVVA
jgi:basic amino acid/polyamine antiporter, APA family